MTSWNDDLFIQRPQMVIIRNIHYLSRRRMFAEIPSSFSSRDLWSLFAALRKSIAGLFWTKEKTQPPLDRETFQTPITRRVLWSGWRPRRRSETLIQEIHNSSTFPQHREKRRVVGDQVPRRTMRGHRSLISRAEPPSVHENRSSMAHYKSSKNIAVYSP